MTEDDRSAAEELARDLGYYDAINFLRQQDSSSLRYARAWADSIARRFPDSKLGKSMPVSSVSP